MRNKWRTLELERKARNVKRDGTNSIFRSYARKLLINARHCQPSKNRFDSNKKKKKKKKNRIRGRVLVKYDLHEDNIKILYCNCIVKLLL